MACHGKRPLRGPSTRALPAPGFVPGIASREDQQLISTMYFSKFSLACMTFVGLSSSFSVFSCTYFSKFALGISPVRWIPW